MCRYIRYTLETIINPPIIQENNGRNLLIFPAIGAAYYIMNDWDTLKSHLVSCEYLQIDPTEPHTAEFIEERSEHVLSQWGPDDDQTHREMLQRSLKEYITTLREGLQIPIIKKISNISKAQEQITEPYAFSRKAAWGIDEPPEKKRKRTVSEVLSKRTSKLIAEKKLSISPDTVNREYIKKEPRQDNFDDYLRRMPKWPN